MIEPMKKVTLFISSNDKMPFLLKLRQSGLIHINPLKDVDSPQIDDVKLILDRVKQARSILSHYTTKNQQSETTSVEAILQWSRKTIDNKSLLDDLDRDFHALDHDWKFYQDWGVVNLNDFQWLVDKRFKINLYRLKRKAVLDVLPIEVITVKMTQTEILVVAINDDNLNLGIPESLPKFSWEELSNLRDSIVHETEQIHHWMKKTACFIADFEAIQALLLQQVKYFEIAGRMKNETSFAYLQGFCPTKQLSSITDLCRNEGVGYWLTDPDHSDDVPTLISNPPWIRIISPVLEFMNVTPGYLEQDVSLVFLVFISIFFAFLMGDAGYGILLIIFAFIASKRMPNVAPDIFRLISLLGVVAVLWGAFTGNWFGTKTLTEIPLLHSMIFGPMEINSSSSTPILMNLCFLVGAIHLSVAHILRGLPHLRSIKILGDIGWVMIVWGMYFIAKMLVMGSSVPSYLNLLIFGGILLVMVFSHFQRNIIKAITEHLVSLPLEVIASFADVVSYIRLFAVGYASLVVADSFNAMAHGIVAVPAFLFGHSLNIILGCMALIVHGMRLNMLEFSSHMGMRWSGKRYSPFRDETV